MCSMLNDKKAVWFGFELNRLQSVLLFILALIGLLNIPFGILEGINQFMDIVFLYYPYHLTNPAVYTIYYIYDDIKNAIITLVVYISFFILCFYTIRKILRDKKNSILKNDSTQEQIRSWFGFKLNQSQSIFLFLLSVIGIISITASFLHGLERYSLSGLFNLLLPADYTSVRRIYFNIIHLLIFILIIYTLIKLKFKFPRKAIGVNTSTFSLILFIISILIIIFLFPRLIYIFSSLIYGTTIMGSFYDVVLPIIILLICSNIISLIIFRKPYNKDGRDKTIRKILLKISPKIRFIVLILSIFGFVIYFALQFKLMLLGSFPVIYSIIFDILRNFFNILLGSIPFLVVFYYLLKKVTLGDTLKTLNDQVSKRWFAQTLSLRIYAITIYWISLAQIIYFAVDLYYNYSAFYDFFFGLFGSHSEVYRYISYIVTVGFVSVFCIYNLITLHSVQKTNLKSEKTV